MNSFEPSVEFYQTFNDQVRERLIASLRRAYGTAQDGRLPEEQGYTEQMFGFCLSGFCEHELTAEIGMSGGVLRLLPQGNTFRFQVGDFILGCYKAGRTERDNIFQSFPNNDAGIRTLNNDEAFLPGLEPKPLTNLVLAHLGNSEDGFCAVYLCAPKRFDENGCVVEWAFAEEIWRRQGDEALSTSPGQSDQTQAPPSEEVGQPFMRRKPMNPSKEDEKIDG
ncbi:MAG TPA: hypothetical protein VJB59_11575 [Bdellovibrionota bacterium]|nr:hypothetical protein [Bdellovibrionota bacterium]